ncbi:DUF397 domain-containing protein [Streptomyces pseudogriseolus]|uniref:DUF397 domain-containing protein n=1 Tax=Streptomyces pseudogriseolus TaxID=36817 RepID=UPI003FA273DF
MTVKPSHGEVAWTKSSYSSDDGPSCVEVAATPAHVLIRDSKNPGGPRLTLAPSTWTTFVEAVPEAS